MKSRSIFRVMSLVGMLFAGNTAFADQHAELIETRQEKFKDMGAAMKVFREELKRDTPDLQAMKAAAATVASYAPDIEGWFPEGTGPGNGIDTDALPYIWKNTAKFSRVSQDLMPAATGLVTAVETGETESIIEAVSAVGRSCKACHQSFRAD